LNKTHIKAQNVRYNNYDNYQIRDYTDQQNEDRLLNNSNFKEYKKFKDFSQDNSNDYKNIQNDKSDLSNRFFSNQFLENNYSLIQEKERLKNKKSANWRSNNASNINQQILRSINHRISEEDKMLTKKLEILERLDNLEEEQLERQKFRNDLNTLEERNRIISKLYRQSQNLMMNKSVDSNKVKNILKYANNDDTKLCTAIPIGIKKPLYTKIREKRDYYFKMHSSSKIYRSKFLIAAIKERLNQLRCSSKKASKSLSRMKVYSSLINPKYPLNIYHPIRNSNDLNQQIVNHISKSKGRKVSFDLTPEKINLIKKVSKKSPINFIGINHITGINGENRMII